MSSATAARWGCLVALLAGCSAESHFAVNFTWEGGKAPADLPSTLYMYAEVEQASSQQPLAIAGPTLYTQGAHLQFGAVPTGTQQLVVNAQLKDSPGSAGQIVAYGISAPFVFAPGKDITVDVQVMLHEVVAVPTTNGIAAGVQVLTSNDSGRVALPSPVTLELFAGAGATKAIISNFPALPSGTGTVTVSSLTPDPATTPPTGFQAFKYTGWDLDAGLSQPCSAGSVCNRTVYVSFLDANGIGSAVSSASVIVDRQPPTLVNPSVTPAAAKVGDIVSIVATPTETLSATPEAHVYLAADGTEIPDFLQFQSGTEYSFRSAPITSTTPNGTYYVQFALTDLTGNTTATYPADESLAFTVDSVVPAISNALTDAATYSEIAGHDRVTLTFDVAEAGATAGVTIAGHAMDCGTGYQSTSPNFTCTYAVQLSSTGDGGAGGGPQPIVITTSDAAGNQDSTTTSVTFDFTPPILTPTVSPNPANAASVPFLAVASSKTLAGAQVSAITRTTGSGTVTAATLEGNGTSWSAALSAGGANGTFTIQVGGTDLVGHAATASTTLTVDTVVPSISNVRTNADTFSEVSPFNHVSVTLDTNKPATVTASIDGVAMNCTATGATSDTCTYTATGNEGSGTKVVSIRAADEAANTAEASTSVVFDFLSPQVTVTAAPNPANATSVLALTIASDKPLATSPSVTITPESGAAGSVTTGTAVGAGTSWTVPLLPVAANGVFDVAATGTDEVGHTTQGTTAFTVNTIPPAITGITTNGQTFSEESGFRHVVVTFSSSEGLDTFPASLSVTLGGSAMRCGTFQPAGPSYTCTYDVTGQEPRGTQAITILAIDAALNQTTAGTSVLFDFTPPSVTASVAPNPANASSSPVLNVSSSKPLSTAPTVTITPNAGASGTLVAGAAQGGGTAWAFPLTATATQGSFTVGVQGTDSVGHPGDATTTFTLDVIVPQILNVTTNASTFSEVSGFNEVQAMFDTSKNISSPTVTVGGTPMTCGARQQATPQFTCTYDISSNGSEGSGTKVVLISVQDDVGNSASTSASVQFDFTLPQLSAAATPNPASASSAPIVSISSSKQLTSASVTSVELISGSGTVTPGTVTGSGTGWSAALQGAGAAGSFSIHVSGTDTLGHTNTTTASFTIDAVPPAITNLRTSTAAGGTAAATFSEVRGYNVVFATFDTPKAATSLTATVAGITLSCGDWQSTSPSYTCQTRALTIADSPGSQTVAVTAVDEVGNTSQASTSVIFDFAPLTLSAMALPPVASASTSSPILSITAGKPLPVAPSVSIAASGRTSGSVTLGSVTGSGTSWSAAINLGTGADSGSYQLAVSGTDNVGHTMTAATPFQVNTSLPSLTLSGTGLGLNGTRFSAKPSYNTVSLAFNYGDALDTSATQLSAVIGGFTAAGQPMTMTCGAWQAAAPNYTCTYSVAGTEKATDGTTAISSLAEVLLPITLHAVDSVGNETFATLSATFDFTPPALLGTATVSYLPAPNMFTTGSPVACKGASNVLTTVTAATTCTDIRVAFTMTETLSANPTVSAAGGMLAFSASTAAGLSYVYDGTTTVAGTPPDNAAYGLTIVAVDEVGNSATLTPATPTVQLDTTAPAAPVTRPGGPITYLRVPWGASATGGGPSYSVTGTSGAAEASSTVLAFDGPSTSVASITGRASAGADGSFGTLALTRSDAPTVWLASADEAGNQSSIVATHEVVWTASFNSKIPNNTTSNPHVMYSVTSGAFVAPTPGVSVAGTTLGSVSNPGDGALREIMTYSDLFTNSPTALTTTWAPSWSEVSTSTTGAPALSGFVSAYDPVRGVTVLFGGDTAGGQSTATWEWDGATWTTPFPQTNPTSKDVGAMVYDGALGVMLLYGGSSGNTWTWDGTNWNELSPANSPSARNAPSMVYDAQRGTVLLFGGEPPATIGNLNETWEWNGTSWTQLFPATSPPGRQAASMVYDSARGVTVLFGGIGDSTIDDTWEWNGTTWTSKTPATSPSARYNAQMVYDAEQGMTVLFGGFGVVTGAQLGDTWEWNGNTWTQEIPAASPSAVDSGALVNDTANGVTFLIGGETSSGPVSGQWTWNGATWSQIAIATPLARVQQAMAYDAAQGETILFGGLAVTAGGTQTYDTATWQFNGTDWTLLSPAASPTGRQGHAMAYDAARGVVVLFGGHTGTSSTGCTTAGTSGDYLCNDVWEWNGTTWTQHTPSTAPSARLGHAMTWDAAHGVTLVFGGYNDSNYLDDMWTWNGTSWTQLTPSALPDARAYASLAYDSARDVAVLFGGEDTSGNESDTWEWNGTSWTQQTPAQAPSARRGAAMDFDRTLGAMILFGGLGSGGTSALLSDTWEWSGSTWTALSPVPSPSGVAFASMVYDSTHQTHVLFGGEGQGAERNGSDATWLLPSGNGNFPASIAAFDFADTGESTSTAAIEQVTVSAHAGGTGSGIVAAPGTGPAVSGALAAAWSWAGGAWRGLSTNGADAGTTSALEYQTSSSWEASQYVIGGPWQAIDVAFLPEQPTGNGASAGALALTDVELSVQYQHSETTCVPTSTTSCLCAADETRCGGICSDTAIDPQNCGSCASDGGTVCTGGTVCSSGACSCPGSEKMCGTACADTTQDPLNCGNCGHACGAYTACKAGVCSKCPAGQTFNGSACVSDIAIRASVNAPGAGGTVAFAVPAAAQVGDQLIVITAPTQRGTPYQATVSSGSGGAWTPIAASVDGGQYLAIFTKVAAAGDPGSNVTVTMTNGPGLNATIVDAYSRSGATLSVATSAISGAPRAAPAVPPLTVTEPNDLVIVAAAQSGASTATLGAPVSVLTQNGGFVVGSYALGQPGYQPGPVISGGSSLFPWEIAQVALASSAR